MDEQHMDMPPGFRFHPTDEELVTHYLSRKIMDVNFDPRAIAEVDLNKSEPWDLPWKAKMGEKEWYFFCVKDRKYPTGLRTNRATKTGYWKATGKDKEIHRGKIQIGMKKTLVFYMGRAPRGEKTNWVMHEYRIETKNSTAFHNLSKAATNEWVICRVFHKSNVENKAFGEETLIESSSSIMPPLMDTGAPVGLPEMAHVTCFSNGMEGHFNYSNLILSNTTTNDYILQNSINFFSKTPFADDGCKPEKEMASLSQETGLTTDVNTETSSVFSNHACDMGGCCLWNY